MSAPRAVTGARATATRAFPVLLASLLVLGGARPAYAQSDTVMLQAVVRIDIQDGPSDVVPALAHNGTLLLPLREFLELCSDRRPIA
jgi:hypothetical protein